MAPTSERREVGMPRGGLFSFPLVIILQTVGVESLALKNKMRPVMGAIKIQLHSLLIFREMKTRTKSET